MTSQHHHSLTPHEIRQVAVLACVCERTVRRHLAGASVRSTCKARIELAMATADTAGRRVAENAAVLARP